MSGQFIVIYGANNLGKTVQTRLLAQKLLESGAELLVIKYPLYHLQPTGPKINRILRDQKDKNRNIKELDLQKLFIQNRHDFQPTLKHLLRSGISVIAEDYLGTGIAWGVTNTIFRDNYDPKDKLKLIRKFEVLNKGLLKPDISILLDGKRFKNGIEKKHRNEDNGSAVWELNREIYQILAKRHGWKTVRANQSVEKVHKEILKKL